MKQQSKKLNVNNKVKIVNVVNQLQQAMKFHNAGDFENAREGYQNILTADSKNFDALHLLGVIETQTGNLEKAVEYFTDAIAINSSSPDIFNNRAGLYTYLKRHTDALKDCDKAIQLNPNFVEAHLNRSQILLELKQYEEALISCDKVIQLKNYPEAYNTRGAILKKLGRHQEALDNFNMALSINNNFVDAYNNRGVLIQELGDPATSISDYNTAIRLRPEYVEAWANRASAYQDLNQLDDTLSNYNHALELRPEDPMIRMHRAFAYLTNGQYKEGWEEYEWRKKTPIFVNSRKYPQPVYTGKEDLSGKTILLYTEQGLGDSIQFSRYINLISEKAAEVLLEVEQPLLYLFAASFPDNVKLIKKGHKIPKFDYHCSLMSLPLAFGTTVDTIPYAQSYLISDPLKRKHWHKKLGAHDKLRVGLVWNGGFRPDRIDLWYVNLRRNILLEKFAVLSNLDINFYSLQKGEAAETELAKLKNKKWKGPRIIDYTQDLTDLSDTAALIENLDLVITVDTSVAHLAAGLGKPTWVLNRFDSCWRWMRNREDSPWYSAVKLYTQETYGDWDSVLEKVRTDLLKYKL